MFVSRKHFARGGLLLGSLFVSIHLRMILYLHVHVAFHRDLAFTDEGDPTILRKASACAEEAPHHIDAFAAIIIKMKEIIVDDKTQKAR